MDDSAMTATDDPKPPSPSDPEGAPPIEEPGETPPDREEPGEGGGTGPGEVPAIA